LSQLDGVLYKEIVEQGLREFPNECCGVIAAADGVPVKVFPMTNADASPVTYRLDGKEQLRVFDELDEQGWDLWAIYHSHTHSEAYPSETDIRLAFYPGGPLRPAVARRPRGTGGEVVLDHRRRGHRRGVEHHMTGLGFTEDQVQRLLAPHHPSERRWGRASASCWTARCW
jgi:proteasome lid subunit RPN8/RPN11